MNKNPAFQHALACLHHPAPLAAALILLLNALVLQPFYPSWLSGKLGDAAWLVIAPLLAAAGLAWLVPARLAQQGRIAGFSAVILTGSAFGLVKACPAANALAVQFLAGTFNFAPKLALDPGDLVALPAILIAWWTWNHTAADARPSLPLNRRSLAALALVGLALLSDAPMPNEVNDGMTTLEMDVDILLSCNHRWYNTKNAMSDFNTPYLSTDGGLTWHSIGSYNYSKTPAPPEGSKITPEPYKCPAAVSQNVIKQTVKTGSETLEFTLIAGQGLYRGENSGAVLQREYELKPGDLLYGALVHQPSGNLVVAAGLNGILVRTPDGNWKKIVPYGERK